MDRQYHVDWEDLEIDWNNPADAIGIGSLALVSVGPVVSLGVVLFPEAITFFLTTGAPTLAGAATRAGMQPQAVSATGLVLKEVQELGHSFDDPMSDPQPSDNLSAGTTEETPILDQKPPANGSGEQGRPSSADPEMQSFFRMGNVY